MNKIIIALISLALVATPALACGGLHELPCHLDDGSIATYFTGKGENVWFDNALILSNGDGIMESSTTPKGSITALQDISLENTRHVTEATINDWITIDPSSRRNPSASFDEQVGWTKSGEVTGTAWLDKTAYIISAGTGEGSGSLGVSIWNGGDLSVIQETGLNTRSVCKDPVYPTMPTFPTCIFCNKPV